MPQFALLLLKYWKPLAVCALLAAIYWIGRFDGIARCQGKQSAAVVQVLQEQAQEARKAQEAADAQAKVLSTLLAKQKANNRILNRSLDNVLAAHPDYRTCHIGADGLRIVNDAIAGGKAQPPGGSPPAVRTP